MQGHKHQLMQHLKPLKHCNNLHKTHVLQLNWSHFKPEFLEKLEENAEAHLFRVNHWMDMH